MKARHLGGVVAAGVLVILFLILTGCGPVENLVVPPRTAMLGELHLNQSYVIQRKTTMKPMAAGDAQPEIHLAYNKQDIPPAEAFERVPFPLGASVSVMSSDANATATATPFYIPVKINAGTEINVSTVEIYANSHVYLARIRTGPEDNVHILLVVPAANATLSTILDLQARDKEYLIPATAPPTQPTTVPVAAP